MTTAPSTIPEPVQRVLQGYLDGLNAAEPPDHDPPWTSAILRHVCARARYPGRSEAITLHERYVTLREAKAADVPVVWFVDADAFALIFREGRCSRCGQTARSKLARIVRTAERPPLEGRVAR